MKKLEHIGLIISKVGWSCGESCGVSEEENYSYLYTNTEVQKLIKTMSFHNTQHLKDFTPMYLELPNTSITKKMLFAKPTRRYYREMRLKFAKLLGITSGQTKRLTQ